MQNCNPLLIIRKLYLKKMKKKLKNSIFFPYFISFRNILRVIYSEKSRSRFFWNLRSGDEKLSLDYPLNSNSVVMIVGAYEGSYLEKLNDKFKCNIYAFEPVAKFYKTLEGKFKGLQNITLLNYGLSDKTEKVNFNISGESSSEFVITEDRALVNMVSITDFFEKHGDMKIDLIYMNIEGGEFAVLYELIKQGLIKNISHLQIQFHNVSKNSRKERLKIRKELKKTHKNVFNFPFIWERWDLLR